MKPNSPFRNNGRTSAEITDKLRLDFDRGVFRPGQFLPSERQLAIQFAAAQHTVRRALKTLEAERRLEIVPRQGYKVLAQVNDPLRGCPLAFVMWESAGVDEWADINVKLLADLRQAADARGWSLLVQVAGTLAPREIAERLLAARAFAVVLSVKDEAVVQAIRDIGLPVVMLDEAVVVDGVDSVVQDDFHGGFIAARHLLSQGCRKVAWLGPFDQNLHTLSRYGGACAGLAMDGKFLTQSTIFATPVGEELSAARRLLAADADRPDGVLALWCSHACAVKQAADEKGLVLGRDLHVVGWCRQDIYGKSIGQLVGAGTALPTVQWSTRPMVEAALARLAERRAVSNLAPQHIRIPVHLITTGSESRFAYTQGV